VDDQGRTTLLEPYLQSTSPGRSVLPLSNYHRQYVGFTKDGERYIYGNFYPSSLSHSSRDERDNEAIYPQIICDGGSRFWGIVYSPSLRSFTHLAFNGIA
jgi:hypothetical protein